MPSKESLPPIEAAAVAWNDARLRALELKRARADEGCEMEALAEPESGFAGAPPCWRTYRQQPPDGWEERLPQSEWCEPCKRREVIHLQYRAAVKHRGACLRRLERLCAPATKAPAR